MTGTIYDLARIRHVYQVTESLSLGTDHILETSHILRLINYWPASPDCSGGKLMYGHFQQCSFYFLIKAFFSCLFRLAVSHPWHKVVSLFNAYRHRGTNTKIQVTGVRMQCRRPILFHPIISMIRSLYQLSYTLTLPHPTCVHVALSRAAVPLSGYSVSNEQKAASKKMLPCPMCPVARNNNKKSLVALPKCYQRILRHTTSMVVQV